MVHFKTRDLPTAAVEFATDGIEFHGLEGDDPRSRYFLFSPFKKAERLAMDFVAGKVIVNARLYSDSLRHAKDVLFEIERTRAAQKMSR